MQVERAHEHCGFMCQRQLACRPQPTEVTILPKSYASDEELPLSFCFLAHWTNVSLGKELPHSAPWEPAGQTDVKLTLQRSQPALACGDLFDDDLQAPQHLLKCLAHLCMDDSAVHGQ